MNDAAPSESPQSRTVRLFVNAKSRRGREWYAKTREHLLAKGVRLEEAEAYRNFDDLIASVRRSVEEKAPIIAIGGGDGTFSSVAKLLHGSDSVLGVLPLGTGNAFARDLGITVDPDFAAETIATGRVRAVDIGEIEGDTFVNVATVGLTTRIARNLDDTDKRRFGRFVYAYALARAYREVRPFKARLKTDNGEREFETLQIVIGVGRYHAGPLPLSPDASITDGRLTIYAIEARNKASLLKMAVMLPFGRQGALSEVHTEEAAYGQLETKPIRWVTTDGEVNIETPVKFRILPRALRVLVPDSFEG